MKQLRILLIAFAMLIVTAAIANAATGGGHGDPTPSPSVEVLDSPSPEPTGTEVPEPTETEAPGSEAKTSDKSGTQPDFSACEGLTGLDNAICRHDALLEIKPKNPGLANSLAHLEANQAAQAERGAAKAADTHGESGSHGSPAS